MTIASGLLWLSELIEEHTKLAKNLGKKSIYVRELKDTYVSTNKRFPGLQGVRLAYVLC